MRLRLVAVREGLVVPEPDPAIGRLGNKATQYAEALMKLVGAENDNAPYALQQLREEAQCMASQSEVTALKHLNENAISPVEIFPTARWVMDQGGLVALQLLIWMWQARRTPHLYEVPSTILANLPKFDRTTQDSWWMLAWKFLPYYYPMPKNQEFLAGLMGIRVESIRRKLHDSFVSFAPSL